MTSKVTVEGEDSDTHGGFHEPGLEVIQCLSLLPPAEADHSFPPRMAAGPLRPVERAWLSLQQVSGVRGQGLERWCSRLGQALGCLAVDKDGHGPMGPSKHQKGAAAGALLQSSAGEQMIPFSRHQGFWLLKPNPV